MISLKCCQSTRQNSLKQPLYLLSRRGSTCTATARPRPRSTKLTTTPQTKLEWGDPLLEFLARQDPGTSGGTFQPLHFCTETTNKTKRDHDVSIYPIRRPHRDGTHFLPPTTPKDSLMGSIQIIYAFRFFQKPLVRNMQLAPGYPRCGLFYV